MADDFLWNTVKGVVKYTSIIAGVAFLGDDIGKSLQDVGADDPNGTLHTVFNATGGLIKGASDLSAGLLSTAANLITDPFVPVDHDAAANAHKALADASAMVAGPEKDAAIQTAHDHINAITHRDLTADDFTNLTAPEQAAKATSDIAGGTYDARGNLQHDPSVIDKNTSFKPNGVMNILGDAYTSIKDSAIGQFAINNPGQAIAGTVVAGAGAEVLGRIGKDAVTHEVNVNVNPIRG